MNADEGELQELANTTMIQKNHPGSAVHTPTLFSLESIASGSGYVKKCRLLFLFLFCGGGVPRDTLGPFKAIRLLLSFEHPNCETQR